MYITFPQGESAKMKAKTFVRTVKSKDGKILEKYVFF